MISGIIFIITFVFFTSVLAKTEYLPPLGPINNVVSDEVDLEIVIERYANSGDDKVILGYSFWNDF